MKYRKALLSSEVTAEIKNIPREIKERYEVDFEEIGCDKNHIHILCSFHSKYSITITFTHTIASTNVEIYSAPICLDHFFQSDPIFYKALKIFSENMWI